MELKEEGNVGPAPIPPSPQAFHDGVASKDVFIHPPSSTADPRLWARIFLPQAHPSLSLHPSSFPPAPSLPLSLPVILYFHGGGFVLCSVARPLCHLLLHRLAKDSQAIVVAVEYRLAPKHRLPAAYDDCFAALTWLQSQASARDADDTDPWLHAFADFSRCYLMGDSAGGNIVHYLSLKLADKKMDPLRIRGHILIQPFFGGSANTASEEVLANDESFPLSTAHWFWEQALPQGADRDHPFCNPMSIPSSVYANAHLPKTLVAISSGDLLKDRQMQYFTMLKEAGVDAHVQLPDGKHAFFVDLSCEAATSFIKGIATFLHDC